MEFGGPELEFILSLWMECWVAGRDKVGATRGRSYACARTSAIRVWGRKLEFKLSLGLEFGVGD